MLTICSTALHEEPTRRSQTGIRPLQHSEEACVSGIVAQHQAPTICQNSVNTLKTSLPKLQDFAPLDWLMLPKLLIGFIAMSAVFACHHIDPTQRYRLANSRYALKHNLRCCVRDDVLIAARQLTTAEGRT